MSHTDEGTVHAYLDGQLSAREAVELERHVAACPDCRTRLEEARALIKQARRVLALAVPPEHAAPPFPAVRAPRLWWRVRFPLAWAAGVVLAVGTAWYVVGGKTGRGARSSTAAAPVALERRVVPFEATPLRAAAPSSTAAAVAAPSATPAPAPAPATGREPSADTSGPQGALAPAQLRTRRDEVAAWPEIGFDVAGGLLGQPPLAIPGVPIRRLARPPTGEAVVVVEQAVDSLTVVRLYERRRPSEGTDTLLERERARAVAPPHPGRDVGPLRLEIQGPLPPDSLSRLLALVK